MISFIVFVLGLAIGSFLNSVIYRLEKGETALKGRSYCPHCKHALSWQDLIPLLSFVLLQGKCRYCANPISFQYPIIELATGLLFLSVYASSSLKTLQSLNDLVGLSLEAVYLWTITSLLIVIFAYDLKHYLIPDKILYPAIALAIVWNFGHWDLFRISDFGFGILPTLFFLLIFLISRGQWMGFGDVKLVFFMGLFLGWPNILVALFIAFLLGAGVGITLILARKKKLKSQVPFGPFLIIGIFVALFWGKTIVDWYLGLLV